MSKDEPKKFSRRKFLRTGALAGGAAVLGLTVGLPTIANLDKSGQLRQKLEQFSLPVADASVTTPQTAIDPLSIAKWSDPVPTFVGARVDASTHRDLAINNLELQEKILPASFYSNLKKPFKDGTYVWGYSINDGHKTVGPLYPAFTIEAKKHVGIKVRYSNSLSNTKLQQYLTVDQTIHWANPDNIGMMSHAAMKPYDGPTPVVTHLHGGEVQSTSDGGPDAWFLPNFTKRGPAWSYGGVTSEYNYPNHQEATTLFYHDHCLGATRINLYAGLAGFYFIRDEFDTGVPGTGLNLPAGPYEIELAIQDRMFDTKGQLLFPDGTTTGLNGPPPNPDIHPYWIPEFFGDVIVVNGKSWPFLEVEPRRYRFRIVDGANARFFNLTLPGLQFWIIGTDGGLLDKPVAVNKLFLAPGERADIIVDFSSAKGTEIIMTNDAAAPYPMGDSPDPNTNGTIMKFIVGKQITGSKDNSFNPAAKGAQLRGSRGLPPAIVRLSDGLGGINPKVKIDKRRMLTLVEVEGDGGPLAPIVNNTGWEGKRADGTVIPGFTKLGPNYLSELPQVGATEQWDIINLTADAHPIHLHLVQFQLINRQDFNIGVNFDTGVIDPAGYRALYDSSFPGKAFIPMYGPPFKYNTPNKAGAVGGNPDITKFLTGKPQGPEPWEKGWKDTFKMFPGQVSRIIVRFAPQDVDLDDSRAGKNSFSFDPTVGPGYVWHCHIVDHEDNEMMRPYTLTDDCKDDDNDDRR
jgi:spore coat protein A, manganese oxidase